MRFTGNFRINNKRAENFIGIRRVVVEYNKYKEAVANRMTEGVGKEKMDAFRAEISSIQTSFAEKVIEDMINMETGLRGYIATDDEGFLEPYFAGHDRLETDLIALNNPIVSEKAIDWVENYAELQIKDTQDAGEHANLSVLYDALSLNIGKQYMDGIRELVKEFTDIESGLLETRNESANVTANMSYIIILTGSVIPVMDMRLKFNMTKTEKTIDTCIIVLEVMLNNESIVIGILADSVQEGVDLDSEHIEPPPKIGTAIDVDFVKGMGNRGEEFIVILDIDRIFTENELVNVKGIKEEEAAN